jgi:hypothetical protein
VFESEGLGEQVICAIFERGGIAVKMESSTADLFS